MASAGKAADARLQRVSYPNTDDTFVIGNIGIFVVSQNEYSGQGRLSISRCEIIIGSRRGIARSEFRSGGVKAGMGRFSNARNTPPFLGHDSLVRQITSLELGTKNNRLTGGGQIAWIGRIGRDEGA